MHLQYLRILIIRCCFGFSLVVRLISTSYFTEQHFERGVSVSERLEVTGRNVSFLPYLLTYLL